MKKNTSYFRWGLTAALSACAVLLFYDTLLQDGVLLPFFGKILKSLMPVIYGAVMAYLLAPIARFFERLLGKAKRPLPPRWLRALGILLTWLCVALGVFLLCVLLIPQLTESVRQLGANLENYYGVVREWLKQLLDDNPQIAEKALGAAEEYYDELLSWIYNSWVPQAQQAVALVTGGIMSVIRFAENLLVGVIVSIYLLATRETVGRRTRKTLQAFLKPRTYARVLKCGSTADRVFSGFVRGKLLDSLIIGILCFVFSVIFRFPYAPIISVVVGVTNLIPFFGPFIGAIPSAFLILLASPGKFFYFILFILALQLFDGNILGPRILGDSTGLSGFCVIVAILVGGGFFGLTGMFLSVPVFACLYAALTEIVHRRLDRRAAPEPSDVPTEELSSDRQ